ncbi:MAG: SDH family Clp fold serine proteinase [Alphaproteobacteria bacterium]
MGEFAWLAAAGAAALAVSLFIYERLSRREVEERIARRESLDAKSYADLLKDYKDALRNMERRSGAVVIDIIHDISDRWTGRDKLPSRLSYEQAFEVAERIRSAKRRPITLILHTLGGYAFPSEMIAQALKNYPGWKIAYVPYVAMSGGTAIALATDEVHMGPDAALGPIDSQYHGFPAEAYNRLLQEKSKDNIDDATLLISYMVEQHERDARERAQELINPRHIKDRRDPKSLVNALMDGTLHHGSRISADEAKKLGIEIVKSCPPEVYAVVDTRLRMLKKVDEKAATNEPLLGQTAPPP